MYAYHVVTGKPMYVGQRIVFDKEHHSGVFQRVQAKKEEVDAIYADPQKYAGVKLEHHTRVALRELALEEVRQREYPHYPSRLHCLYVSETYEEADRWGKFFSEIGRPTYHIVKLKIEGNYFRGDAAKCFDGQPDKYENLKSAKQYWENQTCPGHAPVCEMLADGEITVLEIVKEIYANIPADSRLS